MCIHMLHFIPACMFNYDFVFQNIYIDKKTVGAGGIPTALHFYIDTKRKETICTKSTGYLQWGGAQEGRGEGMNH